MTILHTTFREPVWIRSFGGDSALQSHTLDMLDPVLGLGLHTTEVLLPDIYHIPTPILKEAPDTVGILLQVLNNGTAIVSGPDGGQLINQSKPVYLVRVDNAMTGEVVISGIIKYSDLSPETISIQDSPRINTIEDPNITSSQDNNGIQY